jgi:hypothetical protein
MPSRAEGLVRQRFGGGGRARHVASRAARMFDLLGIIAAIIVPPRLGAVGAVATGGRVCGEHIKRSNAQDSRQSEITNLSVDPAPIASLLRQFEPECV